jgi:hypothetical protein
MTTTGLLHVESDRARLWWSGATTAVECPLDPRRPGHGLDALARREEPGRVLIVIGLSLLECATVALPPVDSVLQRRMLRADAARFFAIEGPVAAGSDGALAWAMPADLLRSICDAASAWGTVDGIVALPILLARTGHDGAIRLPATATTHGDLLLRGGRVQQLRHIAGPVAEPVTPVDWPAVRAKAAHHIWSADDQLLDEDGEAAIHRRDRWRWTVASVAVLIAAATSLLSVDARQARLHSTLTETVVAQDRLTQDAQAAVRRVERARDELRRLDEPAGHLSPLPVLSRLGTLLPRDVTIDALEWDGATWQLQGTASDATALLPLLTGDPLFTDVRALAPSTRFLEGGRQRTAFRIGFQVTPTPSSARTGGTDGR